MFYDIVCGGVELVEVVVGCGQLAGQLAVDRDDYATFRVSPDELTTPAAMTKAEIVMDR